jgi:hypothetical protein
MKVRYKCDARPEYEGRTALNRAAPVDAALPHLDRRRQMDHHCRFANQNPAKGRGNT